MSILRDIPPWADLLEDERVVRQAREHPREGELVGLPGDLHAEAAKALHTRGIDFLWSHQAEAFYSAFERTTIVTTGTASGKSLCFQLPTLQMLSTEAAGRALYLYPAKALAQDQARSLHAFGHKRAQIAIYDGDTPRDQRANVRRNANLVLTNPDMLHVGILPNHQAWSRFFKGLAIVVIDEAHVYRGVFGSHVANVIRRLRRICEYYGTSPRFLLASATVANPGELAAKLTGLDDVRVIARDGSPGTARTIAMWNPPVIDEETQARGSALSEAAQLLVRLVREGARTIVFMKSRKGVELMAKFAAEELKRSGDHKLADQIAPYRAGYTPQQRRELERRLVDGELLGVVATDALELGIDIGALDAAICVTFPGTVASLKQMWGRAGRRGRGLALYVAGEDALDQFFCRHPDDFLERPVEAAILDPYNEQLYAAHLLCAAHEGPLEEADDLVLGPPWRAVADELVGSGHLRERPDGTFVPRHADEYPAGAVSLRSAGLDNVAIVDTSTGEVIGTVDAGPAPSTVHQGAIYLHGGRSYEVEAFSPEDGRAFVGPFEGNWYTQPKRETETVIEQVLAERDALGVKLCFGTVIVTEQVLAYQRKRLQDHEPIDLIPLDLPQTSFSTQALWYSEIGTDDLGTLHAAEHSQIAVLPLLAMCDRWDIGGLSTNWHAQTGGPTIFIYDGHPGGIGIARRGFEAFERLVGDAYRLVSECPCESGCPSCVQSPKCGNLNEPLAKAGCVRLMRSMLRTTPEARGAGRSASRPSRPASR